MFCPKCGTKAIDGAAFCQKCGATLVQDAEPAHTSAESEAIPPLKPVEGGSILSKTVPEKEQNNAPKITAPVQDDAGKGKRSKKRGMGFIALILIATVAAIVVLGGKTKYPDELLYDGLPASRFLEMTREDIDLEFGQSGYVYQNQNRLTGDAYFNYEDIGIDHVTYSRETGKVIYVELWSHYCSFNGKKLDLTAKAALERVLSEGDFFGGPIEIYGSICSGFYYADAVYFSDTDDYVQWKQQQILDNNTTYIDRQMYTIDKHEDYKIGMITYTYDGHNSDEYEAQTFALYTDEWVNYVEESSMGGNIVTAPDIVTPPSDPGTSSVEYAKLVEFGDEESWITLYQDGTFDMQVSLSDTYGTLSGTYEETDWGFACYVKEKSFSGYGSDDVEYFELVICDYGVEYRGDAVGTWTDDGPVYQVVEP